MTAPLRFPRLFLQTLTFIFAVVVIALCARALVVTNENAKLVAASGLPGAKLHTDDLTATSGALAASAGVSLLACLAFMFQLLFRPSHNWTKFSVPTLAFCAVFTLATSISTTVIGMRDAWITLSIQLPASVLDRLVANSGLSLQYVNTAVVKGYMIIEWFLWLSVTLALVAEIIASRKTTTSRSGVDRANMVEDEKYTTDHTSV